MQLPVSQALALLVKVIKKISKRLIDVQKAEISADIPDAPSAAASRVGGETNWKPVAADLDMELTEAGAAVEDSMRERQREMINSLDLSKCVISFAFFSCCH